MKLIRLYIIVIIFLNLVITSCESSYKSDKSLEVHKVICEDVYDYYATSDDSLLFGLSGIVKETSFFNDGTTEYCLKFCMEGFNIIDETPDYRCLVLNQAELGRLEVFLDSCINGSLANSELWVMTVRDDVKFVYDSYDNSLSLSFRPESRMNLQIKPDQLKKVLVKVKRN